MKGYWNTILLTLIGGSLGLQEFYLKRYVLGVLAVLFCWTGVPAIVALIEAIVYLFWGEQKFNQKFNTSERILLND